MQLRRFASPTYRYGAFVLMALAVLVPPVRVDAALVFFNVNSQLDAADAAPGNGTCATAAATCTLRAALQEASLSSGNDVLVIVPLGTYRLTIANPTAQPCASTGATGNLVITNFQARTIGIAGTNPFGTIIDANQIDGVLTINSSTGAVVNLANLTIRGGNRVLRSCDSFGGGIHTYSSSGSPGIVNLTGVVITDNAAQAGGGIFNESSTVNVSKSIIRNNRTALTFPKVSAGGGIENFAGTLTVTDSTINANKAEIVSSGTASDGAGGGIGIFDGPVTITNSTISGNTAHGNGGGIDMFGVISPTVQLRNVTITANTADSNNNGVGDGGGIANSTANMSVDDTIIGGNSDPGGQGVDCFAGSFATLAMRYAILPAAQTCAAVFNPAPVGLLNVSPIPLSVLQPNGGGTPTHDVLGGSPARDAGNPGGCGVPNDQRGVPRPQGARCDLGAVEAGAPDSDADRVPDVIDNCPSVVNLDQRDSDGDKVGELCDNCPSAANPTQATTACLTASSKSATISSTGGTITAGNVAVTFPPNALNGQPGCVSATCPTSVSITGLTDSEFKLGSATSGSGLYLAVKLQPEGVTFNSPVTLTFSWPDADGNPGIIDGTTIAESFLQIFQNGTAITSPCAAQLCGATPCCNPTANTFTVQVTSFSEFAVAEGPPCEPKDLDAPSLTLSRIKAPPTDDRFLLKGVMALPLATAVADIANTSGLGIVLAEAGTGVIAAARASAGKYDPTAKRGWKMKPSGSVWRYADRTATPPGGIRRIVLAEQGVDEALRRVSVVVRGRDVAYAAGTTAQVTLKLDPSTGPCFVARFPGAPGPQCRLNPAGTKLRCK